MTEIRTTNLKLFNDPVWEEVRVIASKLAAEDQDLKEFKRNMPWYIRIFK